MFRPLLRFICYGCGLSFCLGGSFDNDLALVCATCGTMHGVEYGSESTPDRLRMMHPGPEQMEITSEAFAWHLGRKVERELGRTTALNTPEEGKRAQKWRYLRERAVERFWTVVCGMGLLIAVPFWWAGTRIYERFPAGRRRREEGVAFARQDQERHLRWLREHEEKLWAAYREPRPIIAKNVPSRCHYDADLSQPPSHEYCAVVLASLACGHCSKTGTLVWEWNTDLCPRCGRDTMEGRVA